MCLNGLALFYLFSFISNCSLIQIFPSSCLTSLFPSTVLALSVTLSSFPFLSKLNPILTPPYTLIQYSLLYKYFISTPAQAVTMCTQITICRIKCDSCHKQFKLLGLGEEGETIFSMELKKCFLGVVNI